MNLIEKLNRPNFPIGATLAWKEGVGHIVTKSEIQEIKKLISKLQRLEKTA